MALQSCPACGKSYYEFADKCPNCSSPNTRHEYKLWQGFVKDAEKFKEQEKKKLGNRITVFFGL